MNNGGRVNESWEILGFGPEMQDAAAQQAQRPLTLHNLERRGQGLNQFRSIYLCELCSVLWYGAHLHYRIAHLQ